MTPTDDPRDHSPGRVPDLEPQLEAAVWSVLSEAVPVDALARVQERAAALRPAAVIEPVSEPASRIPFLSRSLLMKSLSTVAAVVIVGGAALLLQSSPNAYGEVIKQLREARSFSYTKHIYISGNEKPSDIKIIVAEDGRQRHDRGSGNVSIMDPSSQVRLTLMDLSKTALVHEPQVIPPGFPRKHPVEWLDDLKSHGDKPDKRLGKKMLDGRDVEGFVTIQAQNAYTIWIDSQSKALVQVEHEMPVKGSSITKVVMSDFRFNEKLDESLFSYDAPEGYKAIHNKRFELPKAAGGETSVVEALRGFTKNSAGKFPKSITDWGEFVILVSKGSKDGQVDKESREVMAHLATILPFLTTLPKDDYDYLGAGKTVDDKRCIVFWHRTKDRKLRAIYNDLTISDIEEKDLP